MQDRYCGDAGDFGKYLLLKALARDRKAPVLGVNWYYVPFERAENGDGRHIAYLEPGAKGEGRFRALCPELYDQLREVVYGGPRCVAEIERRGILPEGTLCFSEALPGPLRSRSERGMQRRAWHARAVKEFEGAEILFLDPDNGINPGSVTPAHKNAMKYAFREEIGDLFAAGKTVVVYNHRDRSPAERYAAKIRTLETFLSPGDIMRVLRFRRYSVRDYIFLVQNEHREVVDAVISRLAREPYSDLFSDSVPHFQR
jgi:hypothetical protein